MSDVAQAHAMMTVAEYLAFADADPGQRYELLAGVPVGRWPGTLRHEMIASNIQASLSAPDPGAAGVEATVMRVSPPTKPPISFPSPI